MVAVFNCLTLGPEEIDRRREEWFTKWEARAEALSAREADMCQDLHPDVAGQAKKMGPLLTAEIMESCALPREARDLYKD